MARDYAQAPQIEHNGDKVQGTPDTISDWTNMRSNRLERILFNNIPTKNCAELKIMLALTGQAEHYAVPQKWIEQHCGLTHAGYIKARRSLEEKGWITLVQNDKIIINFDEIYKLDS